MFNGNWWTTIPHWLSCLAVPDIFAETNKRVRWPQISWLEEDPASFWGSVSFHFLRLEERDSYGSSVFRFHMDVSEKNGIPKSSIWIGFSIITIHFGVSLFLGMGYGLQPCCGICSFCENSRSLRCELNGANVHKSQADSRYTLED